MMAYVVELSGIAKKSLRNIGIYIAKDKPRAAEKFVQKLLDSCMSLDEYPFRNPYAPEQGKPGFSGEIRHMIHRPYRIIYTVIENRVIVMDIRHGAQQQE